MDARLFGRLFGISTVLFIVSCNKPPEVSNQPPEPAATPAVTPAATPAPAQELAPPSATPAPVTKRLAPEGVLYLIKRATISTEDGMTGVPVGAEVKVLSPQESGKIRVEYKGSPLSLPASQLTNDLDLVADLTKQAVKPAAPQAPAAVTSTEKPAASQAELEAKRQASVRETKAKQFEVAILQAERLIPQIEEEMQASMRGGNRDYVGGQVVPSDNIENRARRKQIATLRAQISAWRTEISSLRR